MTASRPLLSDAALSSQEQKELICGILADFASDPNVEVLFAYLRHCGLPLTGLRSADDIFPAFLGLYRIRPGHYDIDRACEDLKWWPPIGLRIAEMMAEAEERAEANIKGEKIDT